MKRVFLLLAAAALCVFSGCGSAQREASSAGSPVFVSGNSEMLEKAPSAPESSRAEASSRQTPESGNSEQGDTMKTIRIITESGSFSAKLYDNETAEAFASMLPLTLEMTELNGNEKYHYFSESLPTNSEKPERIHAGDLMLYGSDCLVLFYESFSTVYSYTPLGALDDPAGLAEALGSGNVQVSFQAE